MDTTPRLQEGNKIDTALCLQADKKANKCTLLFLEDAYIINTNYSQALDNVKNCLLNIVNYDIINDKLTNKDSVDYNLDRYHEYINKEKMLNTKHFEFSVEKTGAIGIVYIIENPNQTNINIPDFVSYIAENAFRECSGEKTVYFNNNILTIAKSFSNCKCNKITVDGDTSNLLTLSKMFNGCKDLKEVCFSDRVDCNKIVNTCFMFAECSELRRIKFGHKFNLRSLDDGYRMFNNCSNLTEIESDHLIEINKLAEVDSMFKCCRNVDRHWYKLVDLK